MTYIFVGSKKEDFSEFVNKIHGKEVEKSPDVHILDSTEKNSIGIEEIKDFQKEMMYKPFEEEKQIGIIKEAEKLTPQAQNALLKTLEDSPDTSIYILFVDNERNLLPTIRSRGKIVYSKFRKEIETDDSIKDILNIDLLKQFETVEEYSKTKEKSLLLISSIEEVFKNKLELDIKNGNIDSSKKTLSSLKLLQESREKISANCNRRLTLEAMFIHLNA